jgi:hypothetical protein
MEKYILRYRGQGIMPDEEARHILESADATILDDSARMVLVEAVGAKLKAAVAGMDQWSVSPEHTVPLDDPYPRPEHFF